MATLPKAKKPKVERKLVAVELPPELLYAFKAAVERQGCTMKEAFEYGVRVFIEQTSKK